MSAKAHLEYLPALSIAGVLVAIFYVNGYFSFAGRHFLTALSVGDYVSISLPAFPAILLGVLAGLTTWDDPNVQTWKWRHRKADDTPQASTEASPPRMHFKQAAWWKEVLAFALMMLAFNGFNIGMRNLTPESAWLAVILAFASAFLLGFGFFIFSLWRNLILGGMAIIIYTVCVVAYAFGQSDGARSFVSPPHSLLRVEGEADRCVSVLAFISEGPIVVERGATTLIPWGKVQSITQTRPCPAVRSEPSNA